MFISLGVFVTVGMIAMLHDLPSDGSELILALLAGGRTLIVDVLYALMLQALLIQPLLLRLDRAASGGDSLFTRRQHPNQGPRPSRCEFGLDPGRHS